MRGIILPFLVVTLTSLEVDAGIIVYEDAASFFAVAGATTRANFSEVFTTTDHATSWMTRGDDIRFLYGRNNNDFTSPFRRDDFTSVLPGNEISVRGQDNFHILVGKVIQEPGGEIFAPHESLFSFGLYMAEPTSATGPDSGAEFRDSTFQIDVYDRHIDLIGSFTFNPANDTQAFVGVTSDVAIRQFDITELTDDVGDEFYGDFYAGFTSAAVPEPSTFTLCSIVGLMGLGVRWWKRSRKK